MIIDAHLHLDVNIDGTVQSAAAELDKQLAAAGISRAIVLHLQMQPWTTIEVAAAIAQYPRLRAFINVHPYHDHCIDELVNGIDQLGFIGLKLHPRLQEFDINDSRTLRLVKKAGELQIPVLIDAFPDGTHLMQGFSPVKYAKLAKECPQTNFIWAHMGGHYVLDFMMLAKRLPNVYMDMSYSLLYYEKSAVTDNMIYAMRSMKFERLFYGSDYPDRPIDTSLENSIRILKDKGLNNGELDQLLSKNAIHFFKWNDPVSLINTNKAAELYNTRFREYGRDIRTVGWGNTTDQRLRFDVLFRGLEAKGKTILDVGCGLGDLVPYLEEKTNGDFTYIGIDIAEKLVEDARSRYTKQNIVFYTGDIFSVDIPAVDIAVLSGALSFKTENIEAYANATMEKMFAVCNEAACLNFLSSYVDFELEKNQHYHPETVFSKAKLLSKAVNLIHDYPLYEFTIQVMKI